MKNSSYPPVRKVNNKQSRSVPHIVGSFYSSKMKNVIHYESLSECYFYFFLDLNPNVQAFYPQPVEIKIPTKNKEGESGFWLHVPDVLVRWEDQTYPTLFQVKYEILEDKRQVLINKYCELYSAKQNWNYKVVDIVNIPKVIMKNIKFLHSNRKERSYFKSLVGDIISKVNSEGVITIENLLNMLEDSHEKLMVLPAIYYLIANGSLWVDLKKNINRESEVAIGSIIEQLNILEENRYSENYEFEN
ncbi:TnsA endonuclease C-terminal domain-containing protein [Fictibacillus nanhaiensis]|uniref:TnsA endonuclease C-terminal domain-containing protein n=1 Tax=Fictibacillus nanhaiensis TaxID=742169 RepID=UPI001C986579|nr:TnsA endonuclease C-terminal domain-containing protein [Fictibacillus nanhaiensis]MBY6038330.1 TnsA endonuclease C-terminal domain-containing protein [Fictibacillus nanhaiensis]